MSVTFNSNVSEALKELKQKKEVALEVIGGKAEGYAYDLCPKKTGVLSRSIHHEQFDEDTEIVGTRVKYAPYVELGTRKQRPQPYLRPAAENHVSEYRAILDRVLRG